MRLSQCANESRRVAKPRHAVPQLGGQTSASQPAVPALPRHTDESLVTRIILQTIIELRFATPELGCSIYIECKSLANVGVFSVQRVQLQAANSGQELGQYATTAPDYNGLESLAKSPHSRGRECVTRRYSA